MVGVAPQYASSLGKNANCQTLVLVMLASREVPVMVGPRLFLPESWTGDPERMARAKVPVERQVVLTKPEIAIEETDRVRNAGVRFGCVLADAGYGMSTPFRQATPLEPQPGVQGEGGVGCREGRENAGRAGAAV